MNISCVSVCVCIEAGRGGRIPLKTKEKEEKDKDDGVVARWLLVWVRACFAGFGYSFHSVFAFFT